MSGLSPEFQFQFSVAHSQSNAYGRSSFCVHRVPETIYNKGKFEGMLAARMCFSNFEHLMTFQVHMGTHMWPGVSPRRGRRMSLELQNSGPLFHPYMSVPFLNNLQKVGKVFFFAVLQITFYIFIDIKY